MTTAQIQTWVLSNEGLMLYPLCHCALAVQEVVKYFDEERGNVLNAILSLL